MIIIKELIKTFCYTKRHTFTKLHIDKIFKEKKNLQRKHGKSNSMNTRLLICSYTHTMTLEDCGGFYRGKNVVLTDAVFVLLTRMWMRGAVWKQGMFGEIRVWHQSGSFA